MGKYKVNFLPEQKEVEVETGTTLLQAAEQAGIRLNTLCGGEGLCGECRLQVVDGKAQAGKNAICNSGSNTGHSSVNPNTHPNRRGLNNPK